MLRRLVVRPGSERGCQVITKTPRKNAKQGVGKTDSSKSAAFRMQMQIGARIANQLPTLMGPTEVAKFFGISTQMLRRIECQALYKVQARLVELRQELEA